MLRPDKFFTWWALPLHLLSWTGVVRLDCTALSLFVLGGSTIINLFLNEQYNAPIDIALHYVPAWASLTRPAVELQWMPVGALLLPYLAYRRFDLLAIVQDYRRPRDAWLDL